MSRITYLKIISGQKAGAGAGLARLVLRVLSWPYCAVVRLRNRLYSIGLFKAFNAGVPVICIGNLTTGGTGKTPLVAWLCRTIDQRSRTKNQKCQVAILTRGYRTQKGELSDEPALLASQCPDVPVVVNADRVAGAAEAIRKHGAQLLVMDDGFQHRRLARDLDILAVDATEPFGYGRVLPAGLLREPVTGLSRAHAAVLTRCDQVPNEALSRIELEIRRINRNMVISRSIHAPVAIRAADGSEVALSEMRGKRVFTFCGIGNPQAFYRTIEQLGATIAGFKVFDDHHVYTVDEMTTLCMLAHDRQASLLLTTQKDWTKVARWAARGGDPLPAYVAVDLRITSGEEQLTALIDHVLSGRMAAQGS